MASELRDTPIVKAIQRVRASVVNIRGEKTVLPSPPAGQVASPDASRRVNGMGTGVVIDARGYIMTNHHVVEGVREIVVTLADGQRYIGQARRPATRKPIWPSSRSSRKVRCPSFRSAPRPT